MLRDEYGKRRTSIYCYDRVVNWKVSDTESFSDHNYICFKICNDFILKNDDFRNIRKTRWALYRQELLSNGLNFTCNTLDSKAEKLENCIITAFHNSCSLSKGLTGKNPPYWTKRLDELRKESFKRKRRAERNGV